MVDGSTQTYSSTLGVLQMLEVMDVQRLRVRTFSLDGNIKPRVAMIVGHKATKRFLQTVLPTCGTVDKQKVSYYCEFSPHVEEEMAAELFRTRRRRNPTASSHPHPGCTRAIFAPR